MTMRSCLLECRHIALEYTTKLSVKKVLNVVYWIILAAHFVIRQVSENGRQNYDLDGILAGSILFSRLIFKQQKKTN